MVQAGGVLTMQTKTEAQGYAPDWPTLEERFPEISDKRNCIQRLWDGIKRIFGYARPRLTYAEKWAYIEERCRLSEEDAKFVREHRPKIPDSHRVVLNECVTDDFCEDIVDNLITETSAFGDYKYHDSGTGTNAENATDSALQTPCGESRDAGTQVEGATAKTYKSVATHTYAGTFAITEHGLFNASTGGILMDRTKFAAINVVSGNQIEWTFTIAFTSGG